MCVSAAACPWGVNCKSWGWEETCFSPVLATYCRLVRMPTLETFPADKWPLSHCLSLFCFFLPFPNGKWGNVNGKFPPKGKERKKKKEKSKENPQAWNYCSADVSLVACSTHKLLLFMAKQSNHVLFCPRCEVAQIVPPLLFGSARAVRSPAQGNPTWYPRSHSTMLQGMQPSVQYGIRSSHGTELSVLWEKSVEISSLLWRLFFWP